MTLLAAMRYFAVSHIGLRRSRNEDSYAIYDSGVSQPSADNRGILFVLADGIGGHACGDLASKMACQGLTAIFDGGSAGFEPQEYAKRLNDLIFSVDSRIRQRGLMDSDCMDMGSTLSALLVADKFTVTAHVGDSRIYCLREDRLTQLTTDHSFVQEMIEEGELTPEAALSHPLRSVLTRAVGTQEPLEEVEIRIVDAAPADRFLLCSDGLHDMVTFDEIATILGSGIDPKQSAERLVDAALRNGGRDNITIIAIHLSSPGPEAPQICEKMNTTDQKFCLPPGTTLGNNYQIIKLIGQGGMGSVYLAFDTRLDLQVAVKVISPEFSQTMDGPEFENVLKRFASEAKLAAKIDHPNVIRIFGSNRESVEIDNHRYDIDYLVMELVSGRTLRNTMDVSGFEHEEEIREWISKYLIPILDGVQNVHDCGIIHRDIKPENFLMKDDVPKLADFGLSMGFNLPPVTGSVADIFGTLTYMAPEQFYNFSMARETADIYAIGKILFEAVEGKISEKTKPFQQVKLPSPETVFRKALNSIIMEATEVNPTHRTGSAKLLKEKLMQLLYCGSVNLPAAAAASSPSRAKKILWPATVAVLLALGALTLYRTPPGPTRTRPVELHAPESAQAGSVRYLPYTDNFDPVIRSKDMSILRLMPPAELETSDGNFLAPGKIAIEAFYLSESPITNQQFVDFLNENIGKVKVVDSDVFFDGHLALKISEKIRNYKPITFEGGRFIVKHPMHSACAVLLVTGYGAEVYAKYYNLRLPLPQEWVYAMLSGDHKVAAPMQLPTPVFNYEPDKNGLRGVNQLAEWGKTEDNEFIILGQALPGVTERDLVREKDPSKYYTDTSFRVTKPAKRP